MLLYCNPKKECKIGKNLNERETNGELELALSVKRKKKVEKALKCAWKLFVKVNNGSEEDSWTQEWAVQ